MHGISHYTTTPHTPQQNGVSERRHHHLVETGLTLLHDASLPLSYWPHTFSMATYLINRQPTPFLHNKSPFEALFHQPPNYKLKKYGCLCFPLTKPYNTHKLQPKATPCLFVGYSPTQNAYKCLDPQAYKLYLSRHVLFDKSQTHPLLYSVETQVPAMSISHATPMPLTLLLQPPPMPTRGNAIFASSPGNFLNSSSAPFRDMQSLNSCPNSFQSHEHLHSHSTSHTNPLSEPMAVHDDHHSDPPLPSSHRIHTMTIG